MEKGAGFGELALLYNDKRSASIQATCDCETYVLEGTIFKTMIIKSSIQKRAQKAGFLDSIKLFEQLDKFQKLKLIDGLQSMKYFAGEDVIKEGDIGTEFYIIEQGKCECVKHLIENGEASTIVVRVLEEGAHFGEIALIKKAPRSLTVRA